MRSGTARQGAPVAATALRICAMALRLAAWALVLLVVADAVLPAGGRMYLETNRAYARDVCALMLADGYAGARVSRDSYGNDRLVTAVR